MKKFLKMLRYSRGMYCIEWDLQTFFVIELKEHYDTMHDNYIIIIIISYFVLHVPITYYMYFYYFTDSSTSYVAPL